MRNKKILLLLLSVLITLSLAYGANAAAPVITDATFTHNDDANSYMDNKMTINMSSFISDDNDTVQQLDIQILSYNNSIVKSIQRNTSNRELLELELNENLVGSFSTEIEINATDLQYNSSVGNITLNYNAVNDSPAFVNFSTIENVTFDEDVVHDITLTPYAKDEEGDAFTLRIIGEDISKVDCEIKNNNEIEFKPYSNYYGSATCDIRIEDKNNAYAYTDEQFNINVTQVDDPVVWKNNDISNQIFFEDHSVTLDLDDYFECNDTLGNVSVIFTADTNNNNLSATFNQTSDKAYVKISSAQPNWCGNGTMQINASNNNNKVSSNVFNVQILCNNDDPEWSDLGIVTIQEDAPYQKVRDLDNYIIDPDTPTNQITYFVSYQNSNEVACFINNREELWILPARDYNGNATCRIKAQDGNSVSDAEEIEIDVAPVNDAPVFSAIPDQILPVGSHKTLDLDNYATDPENDPITYSLVYAGSASSVLCDLNGTSLSITAQPNFEGRAVCKVKAYDGSLYSDIKNIYVVVSSDITIPPDISYSPSSDTLTMNEGDSQIFSVNIGNNLEAMWSVDDIFYAYGSSFTYEPGFNDAGTHTVKVEITDNNFNKVENSWQVSVNDITPTPISFSSIAPSSDMFYTAPSDSQNFKVELNNPSGQQVYYKWKKDGVYILPTTSCLSEKANKQNEFNTKINNLNALKNSLASLITQKNEKEQNRTDMLNNGYSPASPEMLALDQEINTLQNQINNYRDQINDLYQDITNLRKDIFKYSICPDNYATFDNQITIKTPNSGTQQIDFEVYDELRKKVASQTWTFSIKHNAYSSQYSTNIYSLTPSQLSHATNIVIEKPGVGKIDFGSNILDLRRVVDLDSFIVIERGLVAIDTEQYPELNKPAIITLYGLEYSTTPKVYYSNKFTNNQNQINEDATAVTIISATPAPTNNGTIVFSVPHFSSFRVGTASNSNSGDNNNGGVSDEEKLVIKKIKVNGESVRDGGTINRIKPEDNLEFKVEIRNDFSRTEDIQIEDVKVAITIFDIDDGSDVDLDSKEKDIDAGEDETFTLDTNVPYKVEDEKKYSVLVEVTGIDSNGTYHKTTETFYLRIKKDKHNIKIRKASASPNIIECNRMIIFDVDVANYGREDEDDAKIKITNTKLGIDKEITFNLDSDPDNSDFERDETITILIPEDAEEGNYEFNVESYYFSYGRYVLSDLQKIQIDVNNCRNINTHGYNGDYENKQNNIDVVITPDKNNNIVKETKIIDNDVLAVLLLGILAILITLSILIIIHLLKTNKRNRLYY